ncbi:MAG: PP2C family protein-serine/threonine phosphatase [Planctomycetota bacterium]
MTRVRVRRLRRKTTTTIRRKTPSQRTGGASGEAARSDGAGGAAADTAPSRGAKARSSAAKLPVTDASPAEKKAGASASRLKTRRSPSGAQRRSGTSGEYDVSVKRQRARQGWSLTTKMAVYFTGVIFVFCVVFGAVVVYFVSRHTEQQIFAQGENLIIGLPETAVEVEDCNSDGAHPDKNRYNDLHDRLQSICDNNPLIYQIRIYTGLHEKPVPLLEVGQKADTIRVTSVVPGGRYQNVILRKGESWKLTVSEGEVEGTNRNIYFYDDYRAGTTSYPSLGVELAYSREEVAKEVNRTVALLVLIGLFFVVAGLLFAYGLATTITRPINILIKDLEVVAEGNLDHQTDSHSRDEIGVLAATFNDMTNELRKAQERAIYMQRIEADLEAAREIQNRLLPKRKPNLPGIDLGVMYESAKQVGGDYYDFIPVDKETLGFVIADVSGKGVPAAMVMATTRTLLRLYAVANLSPADTLSKVNRELTRDLKRGMFVTALYMTLNPLNRELSVASAGHNPLIIYRAASKSVELENPNGIALGFDPGPIFNKVIREKKVTLQVGDRVVIYTDGVTESMNPARKEWGSDTLYEFTRQHADVPSEQFVTSLRETLRQHQGSAEQHDDISYVTFRIEA